MDSPSKDNKTSAGSMDSEKCVQRPAGTTSNSTSSSSGPSVDVRSLEGPDDMVGPTLGDEQWQCIWRTKTLGIAIINYTNVWAETTIVYHNKTKLL